MTRGISRRPVRPEDSVRDSEREERIAVGPPDPYLHSLELIDDPRFDTPTTLNELAHVFSDRRTDPARMRRELVDAFSTLLAFVIDVVRQQQRRRLSQQQCS
jgi:hypothetical protein